MSLVTFIIPHWNNYPLLRHCLFSLRSQTCRDFRVIVIDNGSSDGSPAMIRQNFPEVELITLARNTGFSRAVNLGIKASSSRFLAFLNNDVELSSSWLARMMAGLELEAVTGACACKLLSKEKIPRLDSAGNLIFKSGFGRDRGWGEEDRGQFERREKIFWASGAACLMPRRLFHEVGLWDEDFFAYFEDIDLGLRAHLRGFSCLYLPDAVGYHIGGATGRTRPRLGAALRFRNALIIVIKDFPSPLILANFPSIVFAHLRAMTYLIIKGYWRETLLSERFLFRNLPRFLQKRREIQKSRKVPLETIASLFNPEDFSPAGIRSWFRGLTGNCEDRLTERSPRGSIRELK